MKNAQQLRMTKAQARRFEKALQELSRQERPVDVTPRLWQAQKDAAESQLRDLREHIDPCERVTE